MFSPDERWIVWGDEDGNVFQLNIERRALYVIQDSDYSVSERPLNNKQIGALAIRDGVAYWVEGEHRVCASPVGNDPPGKPRLCWQGERMIGSIIGANTLIANVSLVDPLRFYYEQLGEYDLKTGRLLRQSDLYRGRWNRPTWVNSMSISTDGTILVAASAADSGIIDMKRFVLARRLGTDDAYAIALSPDCKEVIVGVTNGVQIFDVATGKEKVRLRPVKPPGVTDVVASPKGIFMRLIMETRGLLLVG
jgi:WD40 repeat protein